MASPARMELPSHLTEHLDGRAVGDEWLTAPANEEQMLERLMRAAEFLKQNPDLLSGDYDGPEVSGCWR